MTETVVYSYMNAWYLVNGRGRKEYLEMLLKAKREGAPESALYYDYGKEKWILFDEITDPNIINLVHSMHMALRVNRGIPLLDGPTESELLGMPKTDL